MHGKLEGQFSQIKASSNKSAFDACQPPEGYTKVRLTIEEYEELMDSFDHEAGIYTKGIDLIESKVVSITPEQ